ncbi:MAG: hypothetical protein WCJ29_05095 [bacterium]
MGYEQMSDMAKAAGMCPHGNFPSTCTKCKEVQSKNIEVKNQSTRNYPKSPELSNLLKGDRVIFERAVKPDSKVFLIGDGQGADTKQFLDAGVRPENIASLNYEQKEIDAANADLLRDTGVHMEQTDITSKPDSESNLLKKLEKNSRDFAVLMHVLEVPEIRAEREKQLVQNIADALKEDGEAILTQYKEQLKPGNPHYDKVEKVSPESQRGRFGDDWKNKFAEHYGKEWKEGMSWAELSNIRKPEELQKLFGDKFEVKIEEEPYSYVIRLKKKPEAGK